MTAAETSVPDAADCRQRIEAAALASADTIDAVDRCRFTLAGAEAARGVLESGVTGDPLWAAVWVYASSGSDPAPLRPVAANEDPSVRVTAAAALVALGDASGFAVLRESLDDSRPLAASVPPITVGEYVVVSLTRYVAATGLPAPPEAEEELETAQADWADWLESHTSTLVFEETDGTWSLP